MRVNFPELRRLVYNRFDSQDPWALGTSLTQRELTATKIIDAAVAAGIMRKEGFMDAEFLYTDVDVEPWVLADACIANYAVVSETPARSQAKAMSFGRLYGKQ